MALEVLGFQDGNRAMTREALFPPSAGFSDGPPRSAAGAGVPSFSPHDLRHRRVSLLHLAGMPLARIGDLVGHGDIVTTARTYTHVLIDEAELDYAALVLA